MRLKYIMSAIAILLIGFGVMAFLPLAFAFYFHEQASIAPFVYTGLISLVSGIALAITVKKQNFNDLKKKEGLFIVALAWIVISIIAGLPFFFSGISLLDAIFEGVASITTTGTALISGVEFSKTLYFWGTFSSWLGGMGVIVLFIAVLPQFAVAGRQMFAAEVPGPTEDKITPRIKQTAVALWSIYVGLTIFEIIILKCSGMPLFDSLCNSLSMISASGFSYHPINNPQFMTPNYIWIATIFMFLAGVNFSLQYKVYIQKQFKALRHSPEFMTYLYLILGISLFTIFTLVNINGYDINSAIRNAVYQVVAIVTSTGPILPDFDSWSQSTKILIFILMLIGGSAGSASGGIKVVRSIIVFKYLKREIVKILHPKAVMQIKLGKTVVSDDILRQIIAFVIFYFLILILSSIAVCAIENDLTIGILGCTSTLGNVNPILVHNGHGYFSELSSFTKIIFAINMLVGRLELIPFIAMLHKDFWKFHKEQ